MPAGGKKAMVVLGAVDAAVALHRMGVLDERPQPRRGRRRKRSLAPVDVERIQAAENKRQRKRNRGW